MKIYTHDEAMHILEIFENVLCEYDIKIPSPEDDERDPENDASLYGSTYGDLLDDVENAIIDLLNRHKPDAEVIQYEFSGTV